MTFLLSLKKQKSISISISKLACFAIKWASKPENGGGGTKEGTARWVSSTTQDEEEELVDASSADVDDKGFTFRLPESSLIAPRLQRE